jgi:hypothetical protein
MGHIPTTILSLLNLAYFYVYGRLLRDGGWCGIRTHGDGSSPPL